MMVRRTYLKYPYHLHPCMWTLLGPATQGEDCETPPRHQTVAILWLQLLLPFPCPFFICPALSPPISVQILNNCSPIHLLSTPTPKMPLQGAAHNTRLKWGGSSSVVLQWACGGEPVTRQLRAHGNHMSRMPGWVFTLTLQLF